MRGLTIIVGAIQTERAGFDSCVDAYRVDCAEDLEKSDYGNKIVTWAKAYLEEAKLLNEQATQISLEIDGPAVYEEALKMELRQ